VAEPGRGRQFSWYLLNQGAYFTSIGIGTVLVPWLVTVVLRAPPEQVGLTQAAIMLPLLFLLLFGGAKADRSDLRALLLRLHVLQAGPPLLLALLLYFDRLSLPLLILYGVTMSCLGAFAAPARDSLLTRMVDPARPGGMQRAVGIAIAVQTAAQFLGITGAGQAERLGAPLLPLWISVNFLCCAAAIALVAAAPPAAGGPAGKFGERLRAQFAAIREGVAEAAGSPRIRPVVVMMFLSSVLFLGVVLVMLPIAVRDLYGGGAQTISIMFLCFFGGIGISSATVGQFPIRRQGRALMLAMSAGGAVMVVVHFQPPLWGFLLACFAWGLFGGVTSIMARTIVQLSARPSHLARALSVLALATLAGGPIGSFATGYLIKLLGIADAPLVPAAGLVVAWTAMFAFSGLWRLEAQGPDEG
jgi:MFS family permease